MSKDGFIALVQRQVAEAAVGASTLRNQGGSGLVQTARDHFKGLNLAAYSACNSKEDFRKLLDKDTDALKAKFPSAAQHWGTARKGMNVFLRDAFYNRFLFMHYDLARIEAWLETPLDKDVATGLLNSRHNGRLPEWTKIKDLEPPLSDEFQRAAQLVGADHDFARVHVDLLFWRQRRNCP